LRKNRHLVNDDILLQAVTKVTPEALHLTNERHKALWNALGTLAPLDRELITLHYFSDLPLNEVAVSLDKSYPAVRQRLHRLRLILKQRMEEQGYEF